MKIKYYLTCIFLCAGFITKAQSDLLTADSLYKAGSYFQSSVLYERVIYNNTAPVRNEAAINGKLLCLKQQQLYKQAVDFVKRVNNNSVSDSMHQQLLYQQALCAYLSGDFTDCISLVKQNIFIYPNNEKEQMLALINILSLNELQRWKEADSCFREFISSYHRNDSANINNPYNHVPKLKNENTAQWLATFIPGGGEFYAGKPFEALASILLQGAAVYYGIVSWQHKYYLSTWFVGVGLFASFHNGGVRRSEKLVKIYNEKKAIEFNEKVKAQLVKLVNYSQ